MSKMFGEGDRVEVRWRETGDCFPAIIVGVQHDIDGILYDVEYEELVKQKPVRETNISPDRIQLADNFDTNLWQAVTRVPIHVIERVSNIDHLDGEDRGGHGTLLSFQDLMELYNHFTSYQVDSNIITKEKMEVIVSRLTAVLTQEINVDIVKSFEDVTESAKSWVQSEGREDILKLKCVIVSITILLYLLCHEKVAGITLISQETIDHGMKTILTFLNSNIRVLPENLKTEKISSSDKSPSGIAKKKSTKVPNISSVPYFIMELCKIYSPLLVALVDVIALVLDSSKQDDKFCFTAYEIAFQLIKIDFNMVPNNDFVQNMSSSLISLQKSPLRILQVLSYSYPKYRHTLLMELIPIVANIYTAKNPLKLYNIASDSNEGVSNKRITIAFSAVLTTIQAINSMQSNSSYGDSTTNRPEFLQDYKQLCNVFCGELLKRCSHKDMCATYRLITLKMVEDLFTSLVSPDFPVSCVLLEVFLRIIVGQINSIVSNPGQKRDISYMNFLMDTLAAIGPDVRALLLCSKKEKMAAENYAFSSDFIERVSIKLDLLKYHWLQANLLTPAVTLTPSSSSKHVRKNKVAPLSSALLIYCDVSAATLDCVIDESKYFDMRTEINVPSSASVLQHCPGYTDLLAVLPPVDEYDLHCFLLSECLRLNSISASANMDDAHRLTLVLWIQEANTHKKQDVAEYASDLLTDLHKRMRGGVNVSGGGCVGVAKQDEFMQVSLMKELKQRACFSQEWIRKIIRGILTSRCLDQFFESILGTVLLLFAEGSPLIRARAMKTLNVLLKADPDLISREEVKETITERLYDAAICVREEAVKLIGGFVLQGFHIGEEYLNSLLMRLDDTGVSVRKAVVGIVKVILTHQTKHPRYADLCLRLLRLSAQPKEEDSVRELITATFQKLWFLPSESAAIVSSTRPLKTLKKESAMTQGDAADADGLLTAGWKILNVCKTIDYDIEDAKEVGGATGGVDSASNEESAHNLSLANGGFVCVSPDGFLCHSLEEAWAHYRSVVAADTAEIKDTAAVTVAAVAGATITATSSSLEESKSVDNNAMEVVMFQGQDAYASPVHDTAIALTSLNDPAERHLETTASQIVSVANSLEDASWIIDVIRETLNSKGEGAGTPAVVQKRRQASLQHCGKVVEALVELLVRCEEEIASSAGAGRKQSLQQRLVSILVAISLFCKAHPPFFLPYTQLVLPYLKGENNMSYADECLVALNVSEMIEASCVVEGFSLGAKYNEVNEDLSRIAFRFSNLNIGAAVSCMATLAANVTKDVSTLLGLGERCFRGIQQVALAARASKTVSKEQVARLQRCLIVLGYVCEHSRKCASLLSTDRSKFLNSNEESVATSHIGAITAFSAENMNGVCYSAVLFCLSLSDPVLHVRSAQALCSVFTGNPKLILLANTTGLIKRLLGRNQSVDVHKMMLISLRNMMLSEEKRLEATAVKEALVETGEKVRNQKVAPTESDSDFTPAGFILQDHLATFVQFLAHNQRELREAALELIGTLLRQGMLCPLDVISPLISLQGDSEYKIRKDSLKMLQSIEQKHSNFFDNRLLDGVETTFDVQFKARRGAVSAVDEDGLSVFNQLYKLCIASDRRRRTDFIVGLLKKCLNFCSRLNELHSNNINICTSSSSSGSGDSSSISSEESLSDAFIQYQKVAFFSTTLAMLQYELNDEPLLAIYWIGRNVPIASTILTSHMRQSLGVWGAHERVEGEMQAPPDGSKPKRLTSTATATATSSTVGTAKASASLGGDGLIFDPQVFTAYIRSEKTSGKQQSYFVLITSRLLMGTIAWRSLECLLRLKAYLKLIFGLSDERCSAFSPDDKINYEKIKAAEFVDVFKPWDNDTPALPSLATLTFDEKGTIALIRFATADFNRYHLFLEHESSDDFVIAKKKKRAGRPPKSDSETALPKAKKAKLAPKPKLAKKKRAVFSKAGASSEEEDENDSDSDNSSDFGDAQSDD